MKIKSRSGKKNIIKGRWYNINKKIKKKINAKYDKIKDWVMDPKGYFLINIDKELQLIRVAYCTIPDKKMKNDHNMVAEVTGKTAIEIANTLIKKKFISSLQHASDMGIELYKAEVALKYNLEYIQDKDLEIV